MKAKKFAIGVAMLASLSLTALPAHAEPVADSSHADIQATWPQGCSKGKYGNRGYWALCNGGAGQYRVTIRCNGKAKHGPWKWVGSGEKSIAQCSSKPTSAGIDLLSD